MNEFLREVMDKDDLIPIIAVGGGLLIAAIAIVFSAVKAMVVGTAREKTKRELAAYVASGSIDADQAIAMIKAGKDGSMCS